MSHYTTYDVLVLVGIYLTVVSGTNVPVRTKSDLRRSRPESQLQRFFAWFWGNIERVDRRVVVRIALAAMVIQVGSAFRSASGTPRIPSGIAHRLHP